MAFNSGQKSRVLLGDFSLSAKVTQVQLPVETEMFEVTVLADTAKRFVPGHTTATASINGYVDDVTVADQAAWTTQQPLTFFPVGSSIGSAAFLLDALRTNLQVESPLNGVSGFSFAAQTDGIPGYGVSLHDLGAETSSGNATSVDNGAATTGGAVAHLHVTAYSGLTNAVVTIADSADNSSFSTIGTFTTVTAVTGERINIAGNVRRYVRATVAVTGTGSVTYAVALARL